MINDLIYDNGAAPDIRKTFPSVKIEDASDFIHEGRISVEIDTTRFEWYLFLLRTGWAAVSLGFQLDMRMQKNKDDFLGALATWDRERTVKELGCPPEQVPVLLAVIEEFQKQNWDKVGKLLTVDVNRKSISLDGKFIAQYGDRFYVTESLHEIAQQVADSQA